MKINRQFTLVLLGSVLFFALVSMAASYQVLGEMQRHAAYNFLQTTSGFAESMMRDQTDAFEAVGVSAVRDAADEGEDADRWRECVGSTIAVLPSLDFAFVVDRGGGARFFARGA